MKVTIGPLQNYDVEEQVSLDDSNRFGSFIDIDTLQQRECNIVIGTPGKLNYVLDQCKSISVRQLEVLVMDEADR